MQAASQIVPGMLKRFDLPQVAGLIAPRPLAILDPHDPMKNAVDPQTAKQIYEPVRVAYQAAAAANAFRLAFREDLADHIAKD